MHVRGQIVIYSNLNPRPVTGLPSPATKSILFLTFVSPLPPVASFLSLAPFPLNHRELCLNMKSIETGSYLPIEGVLLMRSRTKHWGRNTYSTQHVIYNKMKHKYPEFVDQLEEHGLIYTRVLGEEDYPSSPIGRGWLSTFMTKDKTLAAERFVISHDCKSTMSSLKVLLKFWFTCNETELIVCVCVIC